MLLKVDLISCSFFALWTSVSGDTYIVYDHWEVEVTKCGDGEDNRTRTYNINDPIIINLGYDFFNTNTVVIAGGEILVKAAPPDAIAISDLVLSEYREYNNAKTYDGHLSIVGTDENTQIAHMGITLTIPRKGLPTIRNHVYVAVQGLNSNRPVAQSYIFTLKIAN